MRTKQGIVISATNDKTIVVRVDRQVNHPKYNKRYRVSNKFHVHDEKNDAEVGDIVDIVESKPLSKLKRWNLARIVERSTLPVISQPAAVQSAEEKEIEEITGQKKSTSPGEPSEKLQVDKKVEDNSNIEKSDS